MTHAATLRLGELLISAGLIDRRTLDEALRRQAASGARLGEVLVEMGKLERDELPELLALQAGLREGADPAEIHERLRIGRLLVQAGALEPGALDDALSRSRATGRRIGETLVEAGALSASVLQRFLARQRRLAAVAVAGVALAGALSSPAAAGERSRIDIHASVQTRTLIERQRLPQSVTISEEDVRRGYLDVAQPVEIGIRSNDPAGVRLDVSLNAPQLASVDVREAQGAAVLPAVRATSLFVPQAGPGLRAHTVWLKLRVRLGPDAAPGTVVHPFTLSLSPA